MDGFHNKGALWIGHNWVSKPSHMSLKLSDHFPIPLDERVAAISDARLFEARRPNPGGPESHM